MVDIEEIEEVKEDTQIVENETTETLKEEDRQFSTDGWEELMGKDLLMKSLEAPIESDGPGVQPQDTVIVSFVGRLAETPNVDDGPIFHQADDWLLVVGEKDVLPALEMGIRFMKGDGEIVCIWSHSKYAYGMGKRYNKDTDYTLPPNSNVKYSVTLKKIISSEETEKRTFQLQLYQSKKNIANDIYNNEYVRDNPYTKGRALSIYNRVAQNLDYIIQDTDTYQSLDVITQNGIRDCMLDCLNNIAAVHLTCKSYHDAKESCVKVLQYDTTNFKALVRAAKAALLDPASSYDEVDAAITAAAEQCNNDEKLLNDVERLKTDFQRRKLAHQKREKEMYSKMAKATIGSSKDDNKTKTDNTDKRSKTEADKVNNNTNVENDTIIISEESDYNNQFNTIIQFIKQLPWKKRIIPYGFQIFITFSMAYYFRILKERQEKELLFTSSQQQHQQSINNDEF